MWWLHAVLALAQPIPAEVADDAATERLAVVLAGMEELGWRELERDEQGVRLRAPHTGKLQVLLTPLGEVSIPGPKRKQQDIVAEIGFDPFAATHNVRPVQGPSPLGELGADGRAVWVLHATLYNELQAWRQAAIAAQRTDEPPADQAPESVASQTE